MNLVYDNFGNLAEGVLQLTLEQVRAEFGQANSQREWLMQQLDKISTIAQLTGKLKRMFLWGSFASRKPLPNDLDVLLVFSADFTDADLSNEALSILDHEHARMKYQADVFWIRDNIAPEIFEIFLETYQKDREQRRRGIVEIML